MRFPEFIGEWNFDEFETQVDLRKEKLGKGSTGSIINLEHIVPDVGTLLGTGNFSDSESTKTSFRKNDVLFGKLRPYLRKYYFATFDGGCSTEIWAMYSETMNPRFLYYLIQGKTFMDAAALSFGSKMPRADWNYVKKLRVGFPSIEEQSKIACILSILDRRIEVQRKLIENYKSLIKVICNSLYMNSKISLSSINLKLQTDKIDSDDYLEISGVDIMTGTYQFTANKSPVIGSKNGYKDNLVISTVRPTRGAISILDCDSKISSAFLQLKVNENYSRLFLKEYLRFHKVLDDFGDLCTGSTYPTISKDDLLKYKIPNILKWQAESKIIESASKIIVAPLSSFIWIISVSPLIAYTSPSTELSY